MTIEQAIEILHPDTSQKALWDIEYYAGFNGREATLKACTDACIVACEELNKNRWIPVSERLPAVEDGSLEYNKLFLVTSNIEDRTYTYIAYYSICSGFCGISSVDWDLDKHVLAWRNMPDAYIK